MPFAAKCSRAVVDVLGRDADARAALHGAGPVEAALRRHHHPAAADVEVERLVEALAAVLEQHVLAGDADVGRAVLHVGRHVGRAHDHHRHARPVGADDQLARGLRILGRNDAGRASSGSVSSKMRPLESASVSIGKSNCDRRNPAFYRTRRVVPPPSLTRGACVHGRPAAGARAPGVDVDASATRETGVDGQDLRRQRRQTSAKMRSTQCSWKPGCRRKETR